MPCAVETCTTSAPVPAVDDADCHVSSTPVAVTATRCVSANAMPTTGPPGRIQLLPCAPCRHISMMSAHSTMPSSVVRMRAYRSIDHFHSASTGYHEHEMFAFLARRPRDRYGGGRVTARRRFHNRHWRAEVVRGGKEERVAMTGVDNNGSLCPAARTSVPRARRSSPPRVREHTPCHRRRCTEAAASTPSQELDPAQVLAELLLAVHALRLSTREQRGCR